MKTITRQNSLQGLGLKTMFCLISDIHSACYAIRQREKFDGKEGVLFWFFVYGSKLNRVWQFIYAYQSDRISYFVLLFV